MNETIQVKEYSEHVNLESQTSAISFDSVRDAVNKGDVAYVTRYLSTSEAHTGCDGKTLLHYAAMSGQCRVISELLEAGLDPHARCSTGETPFDLAGRHRHRDALSLFLCHCPPPPSPTEAGERSATGSLVTGTRGGLVGSLAGGKSGAKKEPGSIDDRLILGRKPWRTGSNNSPGEELGQAVVKVKRSARKGRGKRPGFCPIASEGVAAEALIAITRGQCVWNDDPLQAGWVPQTDSDGYRYYWNEALQECRWTDASGNLPAAFPEPSPSHSSTPLGSIYEGPSPTFSTNYDTPWETPDAAWTDAASPVHSPGWPSPRGADGGFMFLPLAAKFSSSPGAHDVAKPTPTDGFSTPPPSPPPSLPTLLPPPTRQGRGSNSAASGGSFNKLAREVTWLGAESAARARAGETSLEHKTVSTLADTVEEEQPRLGTANRGSRQSLDTGTDNRTDSGADDTSASSAGSSDDVDNSNFDSASESSCSPASTESTDGSTEGARDIVEADDDILLASPIPEGPASFASATVARPIKDDSASALVHKRCTTAKGASGVNQMSVSGLPPADELMEIRSDDWGDAELCYRAERTGRFAVASGRADSPWPRERRGNRVRHLPSHRFEFPSTRPREEDLRPTSAAHSQRARQTSALGASKNWR